MDPKAQTELEEDGTISPTTTLKQRWGFLKRMSVAADILMDEDPQVKEALKTLTLRYKEIHPEKNKVQGSNRRNKAGVNKNSRFSILKIKIVSPAKLNSTVNITIIHSIHNNMYKI